MTHSRLFSVAILLSAFSTALLSTSKADLLTGSAVLNAGTNLGISISINTDTGNVDLTFTQNDNGYWFGIGFGGVVMNGTYAIIVDGVNGITERKLGNHSQGTLLTGQVVDNGTTVNSGVRTVSLSRTRLGLTGDHFTFPDTPGEIDLIWAHGDSEALTFHGSTRFGLSDLMVTMVPEPGAATLSLICLSLGMAGSRRRSTRSSYP